MNSGRAIFASGIILGSALGFSIGHVTLWSRYAPTKTSLSSRVVDRAPRDAVLAEPDFLPPDLGNPLQPLPLASNDSAPLPGRENEASSIHEAPLGSRLQTALLDHSGAVPGTVSAPAATALSPEVQRLLPPTLNLLPRVEPPAIQVPHATPLDEHQSEDGAHSVRELIEQELRDAPATQREVWFESLRELSREDAANVLRMWKQFGGPASGMESNPLFHPPAAPAAPAIPEDLPAATSRARQTLMAARELRARNLLHVDSPGFKRLIPLWIECTTADGSCLLTDVQQRMDLAQGPLQPTDSPFDWAIDGAGFFTVTDGQNQFYTRNGHWTLDAERRIVLAGSNPPLSLAGDWSIPETATQLNVSSDGLVTVLLAGSESQAPTSRELGQVDLVRFLNPAALRLTSNSLFAATQASGEAQPGIPGEGGRGNLRQGMIELSNVNVDSEILAIDDLNMLLSE